MNPALIIFGIQSVIRVGRVTNDALEQWARDDEAIFPEINIPDLDREVYVNGFFTQTEYGQYVEGDAAPFAEYWSDSAVIPKKAAIDALFTASVKIRAEKGGDTHRTLAPGRDARRPPDARRGRRWLPRHSGAAPRRRPASSAPHDW